MTPGAYLRQARQSAAMTLEDLALCLNSEPAIACRARAEWLGRIEDGIDPLGCVTARALVEVGRLGLDEEQLAVLMDRAAGVDLTVRLRPCFSPRESAA